MYTSSGSLPDVLASSGVLEARGTQGGSLCTGQNAGQVRSRQRGALVMVFVHD